MIGIRVTPSERVASAMTRRAMWLLIVAAATAAKHGGYSDRMDMIESYLGKFGIRGLPPLSIKFGTTELHGEASSYVKPNDDVWMRKMPDVSWSFPPGVKATVLFLGVRLKCLHYRTRSHLTHVYARPLSHRPRCWRQAGQRHGRWEKGPVRPQPVGRLHHGDAERKQLSRGETVPCTRQHCCEEESVCMDPVQAGK